MKLSTQENLDISKWLTGVDPQENSNWVKVESKKFNSSIPSGSFDISGCTKFRIESEFTAATGPLYMCFDSDTGSNYKNGMVTGTGTSVSGGLSTNPGIVIAGTSQPQKRITEFDKTTKMGTTQASFLIASVETIQLEVARYIGSGAMNTLTFNTSATVTGTITVYKWQDVKVTNLATYELVKEITATGTVLNVNIPWDGETDSTLYYEAVTYTSTDNFALRFNNDSASNYALSDHYFGSSHTTSNTAMTSMQLSIGTGTSHGQGNLKVSGTRRFINSLGGQYSGSVQIGRIQSNSWTNTTSPITSIQIVSQSGLAVTGTLKIYRLATKQILKQNTNPVELVLNKTYTTQPCDETIDVTDCDILEIEGFSPSNSNPINIYFNNDSTISHYTWEQMYGTGNTANGQQITGFPVALIAASNSDVTAKIYPYSKTARMNYNQTPSGVYTGQINVTWNQSATITSVRLYSGGSNVTGKIKVYKKY
jgi:hypothetical protein